MVTRTGSMEVAAHSRFGHFQDPDTGRLRAKHGSPPPGAAPTERVLARSLGVIEACHGRQGRGGSEGMSIRRSDCGGSFQGRGSSVTGRPGRHGKPP